MTIRKYPEDVENFVMKIFSRVAELSAPSMKVAPTQDQIDRAAKEQTQDFLYNKR